MTFGPEAPLPVERPESDPQRLYVRDDDGRRWFLDTGYSRTTCDDDLVAALGLEARGRVRVRGASGRVRATRATVPALTWAGHGVEGLRCTVRDLPTTSSLGDGVAGVLGMDVLGRFGLVLDPARDRVLLGPPPPEPLPGAVTFRPAGLHGPGVRLPFTIDDKTLWPLVDTGANVTCIDAARLPIEVPEAGRVHLRGTGADGGRLVPTWSARDAALAGHPLPPLTIVSLPRPWHAPDLLGMDVLSRFATTWDFARREVVLEPAP